MPIQEFFCPNLDDLVSPVLKYFSPVHYFNSCVTNVQQAWQAALVDRLSFSRCLWRGNKEKMSHLRRYREQGDTRSKVTPPSPLLIISLWLCVCIRGVKLGCISVHVWEYKIYSYFTTVHINQFYPLVGKYVMQKREILNLSFHRVVKPASFRKDLFREVSRQI